MRRAMSPVGARTEYGFAGPAHCRGYSYSVLLVLVAVLSVGAGLTARVSSHSAQRERETELVFRGLAMRAAIRSYYEAGVPAEYPRSLESLLKDPRFPYRVHLRRIYPDPMLSSAEASSARDGGWTLLTDARGGINGVASRSSRQPIKRARFPLGLSLAPQVNSYADWHFSYEPPPKVSPIARSHSR